VFPTDVTPIEDIDCRKLNFAYTSWNADVNEDGSLVIPADVTDIYTSAFGGLLVLKKEFDFVSDPRAILPTSITFEVGCQLTKIHKYAFYAAEITSIDFTNCLNLVEIEYEAFKDKGGGSLQSVIFPCGSTAKVASDTFENAEDVVIHMPDTVEYNPEGEWGNVVILDCLLTEAPSQAPASVPSDAPANVAVDTEGLHLECGAGMYIKNKCKGHDVESCEKCQRGKFNNRAGTKNKRCKRCPINSYQDDKGATECKKCPPGFHSRNKRGEKQCFEESSGKSMKTLGYFDKA
jgi:hypothetical protein